jgi:predicted anti-sigma-YlaC factor YlaD
MLTSKLKISCTVVEFISSRCLDDGKEVPAWLQAHFARCAACRERYEQECRIAQQLAASAQSMRREAPPFLHQRILANLESRSSQGHSSRNRLAFASALVGLAALVALFYFYPSPTTPRSSSHQIATKASPALAKLSASEDLLALSTKLDEPLQTELRLAINDARTALTSLSHNLFPDDVLTSLK